MRKAGQFFKGLVIGLGLGMTFLITIKIGFSIGMHDSSPNAPITGMYIPDGELKNCKCTIHLNPKAIPDMGQIERVK